MVKLKIAQLKARKAPSSASAPKKRAAYEPPKHSTKKPVKGGAKPVDEKTQKVLDGIRKSSAKAAKRAAKLKPSLEAQEQQRKVLEANYLEYLRKRNSAQFGNYEIDADKTGQDGRETLRLLPYAAKTLKGKEKHIVSAFLAGDKDVCDFMVSCALFNAWVWNNFVHRLWSETQDMEPPIRRIVAIKFADLFPGADYGGVFEQYMKLLRNHKDTKQAFNSLGATRFKCMLLFKSEFGNVRPASVLRLYDMLVHPQSARVNLHIVVGASEISDYEPHWQTLPRDCVLLEPQLRKSKDVKAFLIEASDLGYRVMLPYVQLQGNAASTKEVKESALFKDYLKTWKNLRPIVTMDVNSPLKRVRNVSKISDILLT
ncbi:hypothetical protein [Rhizobium phage RHph_N46]|nr:hypothetical protein EVC12_219 [Rhizobium phage RHph_I42]QXV73904.1 hypothetical protein [Rhizobium phage RHph_N46]